MRLVKELVDMTMAELEAERREIIREVERRIVLEYRRIEIEYGPHRLRSTASHDISNAIDRGDGRHTGDSN